MKSFQTGLGGIQLLVVAATFAAMSFVVTPEFQAPATAKTDLAGKAKIAEALELAKESKRKVLLSLAEGQPLPRNAREALAMKPATSSQPEFVRDVKFQHDYDGNSFMVMVYLDYGVVENILGGEQYVYIAGVRSGDGNDTLDWQCGARNVNRTLLPDEC